MALIDLSGLETIQELTTEVRSCRVALESIAQSLLRLTEIPAAPLGPDKPMGPETIGNYAQALMELEGDDADEIRMRLRAHGLNDTQIEAQLVAFLAGRQDEEGTLDD